MYSQLTSVNATSPTKFATNLFNNIDKLFTDRIEFLGGFNLTKGGILFVIMKMFLKVCY